MRLVQGNLGIRAQEKPDRTKRRAWLSCEMLHCTIVMNHLYVMREDQQESLTVGFLTEMFSRPRPKEQARYRAALAVVHAMNNADRTEFVIKPVDYPRIAREMAMR